MTGLKVEVSARAVGLPDAFFLDGCAILWIVAWPSKGTVGSFIENFCKYMLDKLKIADVYLIFDRYYADSIKGLTRFNRDTGASCIYAYIKQQCIMQQLISIYLFQIPFTIIFMIN